MSVAVKSLALAGAVSMACLCFGDDIVVDSGTPPGQDLSAGRVSIDKSGADKALAMELFSEAYLKAGSRGSIGPQGIELLFKAAELDPGSPELARDLVSEIIKAGTMSRSLDRLRDLAMRHPGSPALANIVSDVLEGAGHRAEAIQLLSDALKSAKDDGQVSGDILPSVVAKLSLLQAVSGDISGSDSTIRWALATPPLSGSMQVLQAAMAVYSTAIRKADSARPWWGLGLVRSDAGVYREKLSSVSDRFVSAALDSKEPFNALLYQTAIGVLKAEDRLPDARRALLNGLLNSPGDKSLLATLARVCYDMRDYANACRYWRSALRNGLKPSPFVYSSYALALREAGFLAEAANVYEWQLVMEPGNKASALQLALTYLELGRVDKCLFRLEPFKSDYRAMYLKAVCFDRLKLRVQALDALLRSESLADEGERRFFDGRDYRLLRASFAEKARRADIVKESLQPVIDGNPSDGEVLNFLGYTLADLNSDLPLSESCIRKALEGDPGNPAYLDSMAWLLYRKGAFKEALVWIGKSLAACGDSPDGVIIDHAGDIHMALGDSAKALDCWRSALEAPGDELDPEQVRAKIAAFEKSKDTKGK